MEKQTKARIAFWMKMIGLVAGAIASGFGVTWFKGEPGAELAYKRLSTEVNRLRIEIKEERAFVNGFLDGLKLQLIQKPKEELIVDKSCRTGFDNINGKCVKSVVSVQPKVQLNDFVNKAVMKRSAEPEKVEPLPDTLEQLKQEEAK